MALDPASDPQGLDRVIETLVQAERPVLLADLVGRNPAAVPVLVGLSEALGAPVIDLGGRFNMPLGASSERYELPR